MNRALCWVWVLFADKKKLVAIVRALAERQANGRA